MNWSLFRPRTVWLPTVRGWLLLFAVGGSLGIWSVFHLYGFLAVTDHASAGPVVVEGWASTDILRAAVEEFRRHDYPFLFFTGGPIEPESVEYSRGSYANLGAIRAESLGLPPAAARPLPSVPVQRDRTYAAAAALKEWFAVQGPLPEHLTLVTSGPHARRSRLMFQEAFGPKVQVGVVSVPEGSYDSAHWWKTSTGFRDVTSEFLAYLYARFLFSHAE